MGKKILVVDDSQTTLMALKMMLKDFGYEFVTAGNGVEAVKKAVTEKPDLILMDVLMPKMDGIHAVEAIRAIPEVANIPIIMVSTRAEIESIQKSFSKGCNDYIAKPVDRTELIRKTSKYLTTEKPS